MDAQLAAIIVHDIKNALALLEAELREMTAAPDRERAAHAHGTCLLLQEKLIGFLTLYKAASQGLAAQVDAQSPHDFLAALIAQTGYRKAGVAVSIDERDMPAIAFFDENLVALALEAGLQNAMRFARSHVVLGCRPEQGGIVFTIRDDGAGLGSGEETPSTGLGMNLCNVIAEAHGRAGRKGGATLADHPDGGALFELWLP
ncbi:MAG TPA: ATP-binding protein [Noviherbaspirillum sp.]|nr:ATP-binding protein [Noviherbaspirillum sp.]